MLILAYFVLFIFLIFNFWRIMIKQRKLAIIPLTMFYLCSVVIVITRIINNAAFFDYYAHEDQINNYGKLCYYAPDSSRKSLFESSEYDLGVKTGIIANAFNIILGLFQVASIFELFFVLGQVKVAAQQNEIEAEEPSVIGIAIVYFLASSASIVAFGLLIYELIVCNSYDMSGFRKFDH